MKQRIHAKRIISVFLCALMLFSTWVFTAPDAYANQANGQYSVKVYRQVEKKDANNNKSYVNMAYGGTNHRLWTSQDNYANESGDVFVGDIPAFPESIDTCCSFWGWGGNGRWTIILYIFNYNTNSYQELGRCTAYGTGNGTDATHCADYKVTEDQKPYAAAIAGIDGPDTLVLNPQGGAVSAVYTAGAVRDQYGYNMKTPATVNCTLSNGLEFSDNTLIADETCNRSQDYTCTVEASCGAALVTKEVTIKTFDYNVTFLDADGTPLSAQTGLDYGQSAVAPEAPYLPPTNTTIYTFSGWNGEYTALSGVQEKTVYATYQSAERMYTVTFKDYDGTALGSADFKWQEQIKVPENIQPAKAADGYEYSSWIFQGWSPAIDSSTKITGDGMEFVAQYEGIKIPYTVRFMDEVGEDIIDPQILYYGEMPEVPQQVSKPDDGTYEYRFIGWDQEITAVTKSVIYTARFLKTEKKYTVTFLANDGTVLATIRNQRYHSIPSVIGIVPNYYNKEPDNLYHYSAEWDGDVDAPIEGDTTFKLQYVAQAHTWGNWKTDVLPRCENAGSKSRECADCFYVQTEEIAALGHQMHLQVQAPESGKQGLLYYVCANGCGRLAACVRDGAGNACVGEECTQQQLQSAGLAVPTSTFNDYISTAYGYDYSGRGASLRIEDDVHAHSQGMRFSASMTIPEGVEIMDFGYIYTREDKFKTMSKFVLGGKDVYEKSVFAGNYTDHQTADGTVRTFNLVLDIEKENWDYLYLARPYITYRFAGEVFTVYDSMFAARSVNYVAQRIMAAENEPQFFKDYVQAKIFD